MEPAVALFLVTVLLQIACAVICVKKGKPWFAAIGLLLCGIFTIVGAIRLAKPASPWYERYGYDKRARAWHRFEPTPYIDQLLTERTERPQPPKMGGPMPDFRVRD